MRRIVLLAAALAGGCTVGPHYHAPGMAPPPGYGEPHPANAAPVDLSHWWTTFNDPMLTGLIQRGLSQNLDLAAAASRVREARLTVRETRAGALPTVDATGQAERTRISKNGGFGALAGAFGGGGGGAGGGGTGGGGTGNTPIGVPGNVIDLYSVGFDASWEIDLFGGVRRQVQSARRRVESAEWSRRDSAVSIAAEIADDYFQLRVLQRRAALARAELARERQTLGIIRARGQAGLTANVDVTRQLVQISTAEATLGPIEADGRALIHALGILIGGTPETLLGAFDVDASTASATIAPLPPAVPVGLPSDLLRRRPDIRAAERDLAAATSDIGVAVADLYPRFTITAPFQLLSTGLSDLFQGNSVQATAGGSISFPLLDFGRRRAVIGERRETREQAYITYQQTVLTALRDTEDALARLRIERARRDGLARGAADARRTVDAIAVQYRYGLTDLTTVLNEQQSLLQAEDNLAQSEGTITRQTVALYKALGGGWEALAPVRARPDRHLDDPSPAS